MRGVKNKKILFVRNGYIACHLYTLNMGNKI